MGHVKGIGGLFFRARDPDALNAWYKERLGIGGGCSADDSVPVNEWVWNVTAGPVERLFGVKRVKLHTASSTSDSEVVGLDAATADALRDRLAVAARERMSGL